jgi:2-keto-4-pentenoate hydratase/2-oxohepta-3-ene-1,7-dioic acid hydratase in catechol pathway
MRFANVNNRACVLTNAGALDVERASDHRFSSDPADIYARWEEFRSWASNPVDDGAEPYAGADLGAPSPRPSQVFALALNYAPHAVEAGFDAPDEPLIFTKFPSCISGQLTQVVLPSDTVDWEVEAVVVMGKLAQHVSEDDAWDYVAGLTLGQDLSERTVQMRGKPAQFSLGKSFRGFGPTGPYLVTTDELTTRDEMEISCYLNGEKVQSGRTSEMIFSIPSQIAKISAGCDLLPGDIIFTGTPEGVGLRRTPPRFLRQGDELVSRMEGLGELRQTFVL